MEYNIKRDGGEITVWNEKEAVGLRFYEGETLQLYTCAVILPSWKELKVVDLARVERVAGEIRRWCAERWPREFAELQT